MRTNLLCVIGLGVICMIGGCEEPPKLCTVSGTVLIDGEPLPRGTIRFMPETGRPFSSAILENGSFQLGSSSIGKVGGTDGILPGKYRIAVSASQIVNEPEESIQWLAPRRYADFRTSGLEVNVQVSEDNLLVELAWEGSEEEQTETDDEESGSSPDDEESNATGPETEFEDAQPEEEKVVT